MPEQAIRVLILILVFAAVLLGVEGGIRYVRSRRTEGRAINARLNLIARGIDRGAVLTQLRRQSAVSDLGLPGPLKRIGPALERMLTAAGVSMPVPRLLMLLLLGDLAVFIITAALVTFAGISLTGGRLLLLMTFASAIGIGVPLMILSRKAGTRRKKMEQQFPVALDVFVRGLRAGHPISAALDLLTVEMPDPIGSEFGIVIDEVTYGAELRDALQDMADRWGLEDMHMFVVSLAVQNETGGNLAEILENLSSVIRERASMYMKVRALSSEGRATATVLTALPVLAFTVLFLFNPAFYLDVADDPAFVPGFGGLIGLYAIGFYAIRRMIDLKV